ncbi:DUF6114 domain-containing protein [Streptomyces aurantiogriseus]|uniref:Integral membrane protein n=1 Tax=Streptomyces aurantiogriseus TaxID=66870 RepID=A0A918FKW6_9ACTN|nr:DUF6114 domain-containing protein [Streptomyces aurantiogriseus]GGR48981.1 hypothetical protein GCM10010251_77550 [Streptomyces aurantiogriseus]
MSAETPAAPGQFTRRRLQFRAWRGARPFWAGLFVLLGGFPIMYFPYAHLQIGHLTLAMATTAGAGSLIIGVLLVVLGVSLWFQKHVRVFAGVAAILLGLVSLPVSNFGGFIIGFLFALIGGAMAVSWAPGVPPEPQPAQEADLGEGGAPEGTLPVGGPPAGGTVENPYSTGPAFTKDADGADVPNDLSGTSPANGANGRHSAG